MSARRPSLLAALCLAAALPAAPLAARPASPEGDDDPLLSALVAEALERNPDWRAAEEALAAARARPDQARGLPDPMLALTYANDGWSPTLGSREMTTLGLMWSQELPFPGKRRLRGALAGRDVERAAQQLERARRSLAAAVARAYHGLGEARVLLSLTREQAGIWREIEGVARARYAVGQGVQQDVLRVQVELTRIGQIEAEQEAEAAIRQAELNRLLDRDADAAVEAVAAPAVRPVGEAAAAVIERLSGASPELHGARLAVEQDELGVALARKDLSPDFVVQAGYMNRGSLDPMWQAGVGVRLPLYRRRLQGAVAEAEAQARAARSRVRSVELLLRYRTQQRLARLAAAERSVELYEKGIVPQNRMSVEAALASYQAGKVPFVAVLEALVTLYGDRSTLVTLRARHARLRASLEEAGLDAGEEDGAPMVAGATAAAAPGGGGAMGSMGSR